MDRATLRSIRRATGLLGLVPLMSVGLGARALAAPGPGSPAATAPPQRYSLTVRGGVSLGAYEGGINWTLLRLLEEQPGVDLATVTGASAGNINAFVSAVEWCQDRGISARESPTDNLFWNAWIPVGIHELFPRGQVPGYAEGDGLLARRAFAPAEGQLRAALDDPRRFSRPCPLTVGVSVTRTRPADVVLRSADATAGDDGIHIATQRFVSTFDLRAGPAGLKFHQLSKHDHELGEYLTLPAPDGVVSDAQVVDIIHASSAFPVAFGPKLIQHCPDDDDGAGLPVPTCAARDAIWDKFIDGGVFDNVPLGLAVSLTSQTLAASDAEAVHYVYVDPDHRRTYRPPIVTPPERSDTRSVGLSTTFDFVSHFVQVSEQYELQTVTRYLYKPSDSGTPSTPLPRLSSRFHPLMGSYLGHFGAFLARPFREHDFYVGIYDGLANTARALCGITAAGRLLTDAEATCFTSTVRAAHDRLRLDAPGAAAASYMVRRLLDSELRGAVSPATGARVRQLAGPAGDSLDSWLAARARLAEPGAVAPRIPLLRVLVDVLSCEAESGVKPLGCPPAGKPIDDQDLTEVVDRLRDTMAAASLPADAYFTDSDERAFLGHPLKWMRNAEIDAAERLDQIEHIDGYGPGEHLTAAAQMVLQTEPLRPLTPIDLDPSSIPDRRFTPTRQLFHLLPYEISGDFVHSGWQVAYRPTFGREGGALALIVPLSPWTWRRSTHETLQSAGLGVLYAPDFLLWTGLEAFAKAQCQRFERCTVGGELGAFFLAGKLRLAVAIDSFRDVRWPDAVTIQAGIADINGLIYWGVRQAVQ